MDDYDNVKLELKVKGQIGRLERVKARAEMRTKQRILDQQRKEKEKEIEESIIAKNAPEAVSKKDEDLADKKGK